MESLQLEQLKLPWMEVSREAYPDSGVYAMRHLEMYMGDVEKLNTGFQKFNVSSLFFSLVIIKRSVASKVLTSFLLSTGTLVEEAEGEILP